VSKRSLPVVFLGGLFIAAGVVGIVYHAQELKGGVRVAVMLELVVRLLAVVGGVYALRGANWSRWLLTAWLLLHVILSFGDTSALVAHMLLLVVVTYVFFFSSAAAHFRPDDRV